MTYLSRIRINPLRAEAGKLLANPHAMHGAVSGGVPGHPGAERILWRLDADNPYRPSLLVLTVTKPDWTHIVEQAGWPDAEGEHVTVRDYAPLLEQVARGREFAFRLTAHPVQNTYSPTKPTPAQAAALAPDADGKRPRGLRMSHRTAAAQLQWLLARTERWGFDIPASRTDEPAPGLAFTPCEEETEDTGGSARDPGPAREVRITSRRRHSFAKKGRGANVTLRTATFEGRLRVTDPAAFTERLLGGIGPSKAYGCGLLTLAPLAGRSR
ncbi:type I-E CRISPR-associated protein Cas6/Cse3/CasE [Streptomyces sp. DSM 44917]|uniref:Type I-E CRISPR-associated protein Cas6/Cse3/CasE n=1 Tax=Streptomyces boetiae TaxID=3075541 RepID=A0ABU2LDJ0_9ACTN|nr:type I-E CRISPR-associated protein Cas6/Cse3/CasE [Streptomyces sp. DSM 44917]MDT0309654.1 type I-E CRISPR-associated protein Cas6/Cse3/CasE [Streptomyces sp. DSM 44917]